MSELTTIRMIAERVERDLVGGDIPIDSPYDQDYIIGHVRDAMNEDLKVEILRKRGSQGREDDKSAVAQYIATYEVAVLPDKSTNRVYAELPSYFLSLKRQKGIHAVSSVKKSLVRYIRIYNPGVTSHLPHAILEGVNEGYYVEGLRVFFMRDILKDKITNVLIKLIIAAPHTIGIDDNLPLLPESVGRIIEFVKARIQNRPPQDRKNDNDPTIKLSEDAAQR